ncbi:MAG: RNA polymerase sigma factor [Elusimicrobia bacterium]|nr:RNA polymerase sigma factor [Elusimicrobiota bacterium]
MEERCESKERFGKEDGGTAARNRVLEDFIRRSGEMMLGMAVTLAGDREEARELVQETLYRVARTWSRYEGRRPLEAWFYAIMRNAFIDGKRRKANRDGLSLDAPLSDWPDLDLADVLAADEESVLDAMLRAETTAAVRRALERLQRKHREVLMVCDLGGADYAEAARTLGLPMGTVRSRVFRARQALRGRLAGLVG